MQVTSGLVICGVSSLSFSDFLKALREKKIGLPISLVCRYDGSKLIDAHILLGKIFLERGDRGEAVKYATSAMGIDPNNQEAIALQRQVTMGKP